MAIISVRIRFRGSSSSKAYLTCTYRPSDRNSRHSRARNENQRSAVLRGTNGRQHAAEDMAGQHRRKSRIDLCPRLGGLFPGGDVRHPLDVIGRRESPLHPPRLEYVHLAAGDPTVPQFSAGPPVPRSRAGVLAPSRQRSGPVGTACSVARPPLTDCSHCGPEWMMPHIP